jgi:hypothetical protein
MYLPTGRLDISVVTSELELETTSSNIHGIMIILVVVVLCT